MAIEYNDGTEAQAALATALIQRGLDPSERLVGADAVVAEALANILNGTIGEQAAMTPGAGASGGTGGFIESSVGREGGLIKTQILIDLTGLASSTTDLDIIGVGANPAYLAQITAALNGTPIGGTLECLEAPAGGVTDIDLYAATEGTGVFDGAITALTETAVVTSGAAWTLGRVVGLSPDAIAAGAYLYLTAGAAGTAATYTAGRLLLTIYSRNI